MRNVPSTPARARGSIVGECASPARRVRVQRHTSDCSPTRPTRVEGKHSHRVDVAPERRDEVRGRRRRDDSRATARDDDDATALERARERRTTAVTRTRVETLEGNDGRRDDADVDD